jgi:hypothetical protein
MQRISFLYTGTYNYYTLHSCFFHFCLWRQSQHPWVAMALMVLKQRGPSWSQAQNRLTKYSFHRCCKMWEPSQSSHAAAWLGLAFPRSRGRSNVPSSCILVNHSRYTKQARITNRQNIQYYTTPDYWLSLITRVGLASWPQSPPSGTVKLCYFVLNIN